MDFKDWAGLVLGIGGFLLLWGGKWIANALSKSKDNIQNRYDIDKLLDWKKQCEHKDEERSEERDWIRDQISILNQRTKNL